MMRYAALEREVIRLSISPAVRFIPEPRVDQDADTVRGLLSTVVAVKLLA
jgi:hypothetical protein